MLTIIDETGQRHELYGTPAHIVATIVEGRRLLPTGGRYSVEFDCADADVVMRPRLVFKRSGVRPSPQPSPIGRGR